MNLAQNRFPTRCDINTQIIEKKFVSLRKKKFPSINLKKSSQLWKILKIKKIWIFNKTKICQSALPD